jgi:hypothetical protein
MSGDMGTEGGEEVNLWNTLKKSLYHFSISDHLGGNGQNIFY